MTLAVLCPSCYCLAETQYRSPERNALYRTHRQVWIMRRPTHRRQDMGAEELEPVGDVDLRPQYIRNRGYSFRPEFLRGSGPGRPRIAGRSPAPSGFDPGRLSSLESLSIATS